MTVKPAHATTQQMLLATFLEESFDGIEHLEAGLLQLDGGVSRELIDELFRVVHSMKGGAGAIGAVELGPLAHAMESILDRLRGGEPPAADTAAVLLRGVDAIRGSLRERQAGGTPRPEMLAAATAEVECHAARGAARREAPAPAAAAAPRWEIDLAPRRDLFRTGPDPSQLLRGLAALGELHVEADLAGLPELDRLDPTECHLRWRATLAGDVPRAAIDDLLGWLDGQCDAVIRRVEAAAPRAPTPDEAAIHAPAPGAAVTTIRVGVDKIDQLMNMVGELVITQSMLGELDDGPLDAGRLARIREGLGQLARNTRALQDSVMRLRSMPISTVFKRLPRLVHDLGHRLGKEVALEISGESTELDKAVLEHLGEAVVHLVRNCVDHGIEPAEQRVAAGKPRTGTIRLSAEHRGGDVVVEIADDGGGLDPERIAAAAQRRGLLPPGATLDEAAAAQLVFQAGFSTASEVSEVSGRGVGLDVVRRYVKDLGGDITLDSRRGHGVRFALRLPLTLAIIDGQLVQVGDHQFVIPLLSIIESVAIDPQCRSRLAGACDVYQLRRQLIPMIELSGMLDLPPSRRTGRGVMVIVSAAGERLGFVVDELLAQQQVVVKSLETNYQRVPGLSGATILGDGRVAFILDITALGQAARGHIPAIATTAA